MSLRVLETRLRGALVETRFPFRFGIAEMNEIAHIVLFATFEVDGARELGVAADHLPPKWFTKNPETSYREDVVEMLEVIERACEIARRSEDDDSVFDLWYRVYCEQTRSGDPAVAPLLTGFGVSFLERAAIDAFCRAKNVSFAEAVRTNALGMRLEALHPELAGHDASEFLPRRPLTSLAVRHTVGLSDRLDDSEGRTGSQPDGLPESLEACIRRYGLRRFKVKVGGNRERDLDRIERIGQVLDRELHGDYRVTLDGNEQFAHVSALRAFWDDLLSGPGTEELGRRIDYVEQPLPRELALGADTSGGLAAWTGRPRLIIDESDDSLDAVARAIEVGYDGGAFKSSKGVFKGIGNACRIEQMRRDDPRRGFVYSAEDLSTIPPVGLLADLAVIATLGIDEPERNGYHYFRGLLELPARARRELIEHHEDLFSPHADGSAALRIERGKISVKSVVDAPFGVGFGCDFEAALQSVDQLIAALR